MAKDLQVGSDIFSYPEQGEKAGWGDEATSWAEAVSIALNDLSGPNDILLTSANLANNQSTAANITGLVFDTSKVQGIEVDYFISRTFDSGSSTVTEQGKILGSYDGTNFTISLEATGDSAVIISVTPTGQFQYISDDKSNHVSSVIRYRARTIDQP